MTLSTVLECIYRKLRILPKWMIEVLGLMTLLYPENGTPQDGIPEGIPTGALHAEAQQLFNRISPSLEPGAGLMMEFISSCPMEGTSTLAREFALAASQYTDEAVLLLDFDFKQRSQMHFYRELLEDPSGGTESLPDWITNIPTYLRSATSRAAPTFHFRSINQKGLIIGYLDPQVDSHPVVDNSVEFWSYLRKHTVMTIVDAPAFSQCYDGITISRAMDGVIPLVASETTRRPVVQKLLMELEAHDAPLIGAVFNKRRFFIPQRVYRLLDKF